MALDGRMWDLDPAAANTAGPFNGVPTGQITLKVPVMEGDLVLVQSGIDTSVANPGDVLQDAKYGLLRDNLGNSYQKAAFVNDPTSNQSTTGWIGTVTRPGIVTVTMMALPTPGTTNLASAYLQIDRLVGPGKLVPWMLDGAPAQVVLVAPGNGVDALASGNVTLALRGGIMVCMVQDNSNGLQINAGTGFTGGSGSGTSWGSVTEVKVATGPGTIQGTATTLTGGADRFGVLAFVVSWPLVDGDTGAPAPQQQDEG